EGERRRPARASPRDRHPERARLVPGRHFLAEPLLGEFLAVAFGRLADLPANLHRGRVHEEVERAVLDRRDTGSEEQQNQERQDEPCSFLEHACNSFCQGRPYVFSPLPSGERGRKQAGQWLKTNSLDVSTDQKRSSSVPRRVVVLSSAASASSARNFFNSASV